jgi:hypothetical protein
MRGQQRCRAHCCHSPQAAGHLLLLMLLSQLAAGRLQQCAARPPAAAAVVQPVATAAVCVLRRLYVDCCLCGRLVAREQVFVFFVGRVVCVDVTCVPLM